MIQSPLKAENLKDRYDGLVEWILHRRTDGFCSLQIIFFLPEMDRLKSLQCSCIPELSLIF